MLDLPERSVLVQGSTTGKCSGLARSRSSRSRGLLGCCISASRMTEDWLPTAPGVADTTNRCRRSQAFIARIKAPSFRGGLHATLSQAIHQIGAVSRASRISNLLGASNTRETTASGGRHHQYASSADARMASAGHRLAPYRSPEFSRTWRRRCCRPLPRADVAGRRRYKR